MIFRNSQVASRQDGSQQHDRRQADSRRLVVNPITQELAADCLLHVWQRLTYLLVTLKVPDFPLILNMDLAM